MEKRYKFRIYPTKVQKEQIKHNLGCARFIYNYYLNKRIEAYKNGEGIIDLYTCFRDVTQLKKTEEYQWLSIADVNSLQHAIKQLDLAFKAFFRNTKKKGVSPGFPRFKSKKDTRQSYTSPSHTQRRYVSKKTGEVREYEASVALGDDSIKLPKLGHVRCRVSKKVQGRILSATIIQVSSGKYYASILFTECENKALPKTEKAVGLHLGIRMLVTTSEGEKIENQGYLKKSSKRIAKLHRNLLRKADGSKNFEKARICLAKAYEHAKYQKADMLHKLSSRLVHEYDVICVRNADLMAIMRDAIYAKLFADAGWGEFIKNLKYKCEWYGKTFVKVDSWFPSVQLCSSCGERYREVGKKLYVHQWKCPNCGGQHIRGINAAINVKNEGLRFLSI